MQFRKVFWKGLVVLDIPVGPLQGLASLAAILKDAELIQVVLQLMEKDISRYQIQESNPGPFQKPMADLLGGFFRDDDQLQLEHRKTLRIDDTAMCLIAITSHARNTDFHQIGGGSKLSRRSLIAKKVTSAAGSRRMFHWLESSYHVVIRAIVNYIIFYHLPIQP